MNSYFSHAFPLDTKTCFLFVKILIFRKKLGVTCYCLLFLRNENKRRKKTLIVTLIREKEVCENRVRIRGSSYLSGRNDDKSLHASKP